MFMRLPLLGTALLGSFALGCGINASPDAPDAEASSSTTALVAVERMAGPGDAVRGDAVVARFVRVRGTLDDGALRLAGVPQDLPAVGTCAANPNTETAAPSPRAVDLLDVGTLSVDERELGQRVMPDPAGIVSGVFYTKTANETFVPGKALVLRATGGRDLGEAFTANALAPRELEGVKVFANGGSLDVVWDVAVDEKSAGDRIAIDVLGPANRLLTRCTTTDVGRASVPFAADEAQIVVHRVRVEPFVARGVDRGEIRFDLARAVAFRR